MFYCNLHINTFSQTNDEKQIIIKKIKYKILLSIKIILLIIKNIFHASNPLFKFDRRICVLFLLVKNHQYVVQF